MLTLLKKILRIDGCKDIGNIITVLSQGFHAIGPFTVLHATAMFFAGIFFWGLYGSILAKPANLFEWTPGSLFHFLDPAAQGIIIKIYFLSKCTGNKK